MPTKTSDIAATTTAITTISFPWWWEQLPILLAPLVAILGFGIAVFTVWAKYYEMRTNRAKAQVAEVQASAKTLGF